MAEMSRKFRCYLIERTDQRHKRKNAHRGHAFVVIRKYVCPIQLSAGISAILEVYDKLDLPAFRLRAS